MSPGWRYCCLGQILGGEAVLTPPFGRPPTNIHRPWTILSTHDSLDVFVLAVDLLDPEDVVAEVEAVEAALLAEEGDDGAAGPVDALAEHLLDVELVLPHRDAVHKLRMGRNESFISLHNELGFQILLKIEEMQVLNLVWLNFGRS